MRIRPLLLASLLACAAAPQAATGAPCLGFTDVQDTDIFCTAVQWIKNRGVTSGCTATEYCPGNPVTRAQMALFLHRLGKALTPVVLHKQAVVTAQTTVPGAQPGLLLCATDDYAVGGFPRTARFKSTFSAVPDQTAWLGGYLRYSTDGGSTWTTIGALGTDTWPGRAWAGNGEVAGAAVLTPPLALATETTYRFGMWLYGLGGNYIFHGLICQIEVEIGSANPGTAPFDE